MGSKPQLFTKDVERGLKSAGFSAKPQKGTSHIHWVKVKNGTKFKVTVDPHHEPFSDDLVKSMASQAGLSVKQFYEICSKTGAKAAKKGLLDWLFD